MIDRAATLLRLVLLPQRQTWAPSHPASKMRPSCQCTAPQFGLSGLLPAVPLAYIGLYTAAPRIKPDIARLPSCATPHCPAFPREAALYLLTLQNQRRGPQPGEGSQRSHCSTENCDFFTASTASRIALPAAARSYLRKQQAKDDGTVKRRSGRYLTSHCCTRDSETLYSRTKKQCIEDAGNITRRRNGTKQKKAFSPQKRRPALIPLRHRSTAHIAHVMTGEWVLARGQKKAGRGSR